MRTVLSWLCDFADFYSLVDTANPDHVGELIVKLEAAMNSRGLVVEGVERSGLGLDRVVVAKVVEIDAIDGADRIRTVMVDAGGTELEQIVCGAFNFSLGDYVPLARVGAVLPGDFEIASRKMRGITSNGMLCSARELALGTEYDGLLILDPTSVAGTPLIDALGIVPDVVFDLAIEANRPDANCHLGVARELATHFGLDFTNPPVMDLSSIEVKAIDSSRIRSFGCDSLVLAGFEGPATYSVGDFVARRLALAGMRSISALVDASNYVMLELGQPTHPYDLKLLENSAIGVRDAHMGEELVTLDGATRKLGVGKVSSGPVADVVIVDANDVVIGIAGIMGGSASEISPATSTALLEVAHFRPEFIAKTSKRLNLRSEASARFERGVDPGIANTALARFCMLIGTAPSWISQYEDLDQASVVRVEFAEIRRILGPEVAPLSIVQDLRRMGFVSVSRDEESITFMIPSNRPDVSTPIDMIEEFARHFGYSNIERRKLLVPNVGGLTAIQKIRRQIVEFSCARGFFEAWSPTLLAPGEQELVGDQTPKISVSNPMAIDESVLRRSLLPGLLRSVVSNVRRGESRIALFEIGHVFSLPIDEDGFPRESERGAWVCYREQMPPQSPYELLRDLFFTFGLSLDVPFDLVRIADLDQDPLAMAGFVGLHPNNGVALRVGNEVVGQLGELNPYVIEDLMGGVARGAITVLELELATSLYIPPTDRASIVVSPYPRAEFDLSFVVTQETLASTIEKITRQSLSRYQAKVLLIDDYCGSGLKGAARSLTLRISVGSLDHTLAEAEIRRIRQDVISAVGRESEAVLRE